MKAPKPREWIIGWNNAIKPINHTSETLDTKYHVIEIAAYNEALDLIEKCERAMRECCEDDCVIAERAGIYEVLAKINEWKGNK